MSVVSRSWLDVTSDKRYKKHKSSSSIQIQCEENIACGSLVQTKFGSCNYLVLNKGFQNTGFAMYLIIFDTDKKYFMESSIQKLDWGSIRSSLRYSLSTPYRLTIRNSARLFHLHHVLFNMLNLHLFLPALNFSTLNAGILIMMQH